MNSPPFKSTRAIFWLGFLLFLAGCVGSPATQNTNTDPTAPFISAQPLSQAVTAGQTATFTVTATGTPPLGYQWQKNAANIPGATSASFTTPASTALDNGASFDLVVSNTAGSVISSTAILTVNPGTGTANVFTYHNDNARTGQNLGEAILTLTNVQSTKFGKKGFPSFQSLVDAQPLYVSNLTVVGASRNVVSSPPSTI